MSKFAVIAGTVSVALFTCMGCGGAAGPSGGDDADPTGGQSEVPGAGRVLEPNREPSREVNREPPSPRGGEGTSERNAAPESLGVLGTLRPGCSRSARENVCITFGVDDTILAIDEHECSLVNEFAEVVPTFMCGGCIVELRPAANGGWLLMAEAGAAECRIAGTYLVGFGETIRECSPPTREP